MNKLCEKIIPDWSVLKKFETNSVVRGMHIWLILVPVLAKTMSLFEGPLKIKILDNIYVFDISLPFTWVLFFMAALSFTIANVLFIFYAPKIIQENNDLSDFQRAGKDEGHLEAYFSQSMMVKWKRYIQDLGRDSLDMISTSPVSPDIKSWFWKAYTDQNSALQLARKVCFAFYSISFFLILIVMLQNILWVVQQINI